MKKFKKRGYGKTKWNLGKSGAVLLLIIIFQAAALFFFSNQDFIRDWDFKGQLTSQKNIGVSVNILDNLPPNITSYYKNETSFNVNGNQEIYFNLSFYDPEGEILDVYWYLDNSLKRFNSNFSFDSFRYTFGCGISGNHKIKSAVSDRYKNDSVEWDINVNLFACQSGDSGGSGGGGGGGGGGGATAAKCTENWNCLTWTSCKNLIKSGEELNKENKDYIQEKCNQLNYNENSCGFKIRFCSDFNKCSTDLTKPATMESCYYNIQANCEDNIKNQNEEGIDCGGICEDCETPQIESRYYWWIWLLLLLILIILFLIYKLSIKIILVGGDRVIKILGFIGKRRFINLNVGSYFSWKGKRYRIKSKKNNNLYVTENYSK